jgi:hypothetical protein
MQRDEALAFACGPLCLQVHSILPLAMQPVSICVEPILQGPDVVTWLAKGARFLTLIKTTAGTRVYDHAEDMLYYANPNTELHMDCPEGYAFLCQSVCDALPDGSAVPRLLVMDLVCPRIECPRQRGVTLRRMSHVFPHVCHVQWAGDKLALQRFVESGLVPHAVEAPVALRAPLQLVREPASGIAVLNLLQSL